MYRSGPRTVTPAQRFARAPAMRRRRQRGMTLVELVLAIVVIGIAVAGVLLAYTQAVLRSADPMIASQAVAIAEAYLDEILAKPVNGPPSGGTRATYGSVGDYHGLVDNPPRDQNGTPIPALAAYTVSVSVGGDDLGIGAQQVQVTVAHPSGSLVVRGHRADY